MQHIETVTVGSGGAASITFSAIPDTFTDLYLVLSGRTSQVNEGTGILLTLNGISTGFSQRRLFGTGSGSPISDTATAALWITGSNATSNTFSNTSIYFPNYASDQNKSYSNDGVTENNATTAFAAIVAGLWSNTAAINSIQLTPQQGSFVEFSSASLYGITAGSDGIVAVS